MSVYSSRLLAACCVTSQTLPGFYSVPRGVACDRFTLPCSGDEPMSVGGIIKLSSLSACVFIAEVVE